MSGNGYITEERLGFDHPDLATDYDLLEVRQLAREAGIDLSLPSVQTQIQKRRRAAVDLAPPAPPKFYAALQNVMQTAGHLITSGVMSGLAYIVTPISLVLLARAEVQRLEDGIGIFDPLRANTFALVVVVAYIMLLVIISERATEQQIARYKFSLRILVSNVGYWLGVSSRRWKPKVITQNDLLHLSSVWASRVILLLGTTGSLKNDIGTRPENENWRQSIKALVWDSGLETFLGLVGAFLLTGFLLFALRFIIDHLWQSYRKLVPAGADFLSLSGESSAEADSAEIEYLLSRIRQKQQAD